jgi:hypothetical protein
MTKGKLRSWIFAYSRLPSGEEKDRMWNQLSADQQEQVRREQAKNTEAATVNPTNLAASSRSSAQTTQPLVPIKPSRSKFGWFTDALSLEP